MDSSVDRDQVYRAERENQCLRPYVQKEAILPKLGDCRPLDLEAFVTCSDGERDKRNGLEQEREFFDHELSIQGVVRSVGFNQSAVRWDPSEFLASSGYYLC